MVSIADLEDTATMLSRSRAMAHRLFERAQAERDDARARALELEQLLSDRIAAIDRDPGATSATRAAALRCRPARTVSEGMANSYVLAELELPVDTGDIVEDLGAQIRALRAARSRLEREAIGWSSAARRLQERHVTVEALTAHDAGPVG